MQQLLFRERAALAEEAAFASIDLVNTVFANRIDKVNQELDFLNAAREAELEAAGDNAEAQAAIEKEFAMQEAALQRQLAEEQRRAAVFNKGVAAADTIATTARGIATATATFGSNPFTAPLLPGVIALIAGTGALQLATILATPIPAFAEGTSFAPGGPALIGEQGPEIVIPPSGAAYVSPPGPSVIDIARGSQVLPAKESEAVLSSIERDLEGGREIDILALQLEQIERLITAREEELLAAIEGRKEYNFIVSKEGIDVFIKHRGNTTKYYNERYR